MKAYQEGFLMSSGHHIEDAPPQGDHWHDFYKGKGHGALHRYGDDAVAVVHSSMDHCENCGTGNGHSTMVRDLKKLPNSSCDCSLITSHIEDVPREFLGQLGERGEHERERRARSDADPERTEKARSILHELKKLQDLAHQRHRRRPLRVEDIPAISLPTYHLLVNQEEANHEKRRGQRTKED